MAGAAIVVQALMLRASVERAVRTHEAFRRFLVVFVLPGAATFAALAVALVAAR